MTESAPDPPETEDPYWWTPYLVLAAIMLFGLLGYLGKLGPERSAASAADTPVPAPSGSAHP